MLTQLRHGLGEHLKANIVQYFVVILLFIIGIVIGAMAVKMLPESQKGELVGYLNIFFSQLAEQPGGDAAMLGSVLWSRCKMMLLIWLMGFTIIGIPFILFVVFTRGFIIGFTVGFLVNEYVFKGLTFALVSVLPHNLIAVPVLLAAAVTAICFSVRLIRRKKQAGHKLLTDSLNYSVLCAFSVLAIMLSALVEVYISPVFMKFAIRLF